MGQNAYVRGGVATVLATLQVMFGLPLIAPATCVAQAQTIAPRVWMGPVDAGDAPGASLVTRTLDETARADLNRRSEVETTDQGDIGPIAAGDTDPRVDRAERLRVAAKEAFARGDDKTALEQLQAALQLYEAGLASINKVEAVLETLGYLGAISQKLGFDDDAKDYFRRVIAAAPDAEPLDEYPEAARALYSSEKKKLLKKKKGRLKVVTTPPGAVVRLDGVEVGKAPVTLRDLVRGDHYIQAADDTAGLAATRIRVKGGRTTTATLELSTEVGPPPTEQPTESEVGALVGLARSGQLGPPFREMCEAVAKKTRADYVVVSFVSPQGAGFVLEAYIYGVEQKQTAAFDPFKFRANLASATVQATQLAAAIAKAANAFPEDKIVVGGVVARPEPAPPPVEPPPPEPDPVPAAPPTPEPAPAPRVARTGPERAPVRSTQPVPVELPDEDDDDEGVPAWVWIAAGVAVVGGGVAAGALLLDEGGSSSRFDAEVRW